MRFCQTSFSADMVKPWNSVLELIHIQDRIYKETDHSQISDVWQFILWWWSGKTFCINKDSPYSTSGFHNLFITVSLENVQNAVWHTILTETPRKRKKYFWLRWVWDVLFYFSGALKFPILARESVSHFSLCEFKMCLKWKHLF